MAKEDLAKICFNCNSFYPADNKDFDYGICLNDVEFESYLDELIERQNYDCCKELIARKRFHGDTEACEHIEYCEVIEIDDASSVGKLLKEKVSGSDIRKERFRDAVLLDYIKNIDWKTMPVEAYVTGLYGSSEKERKSAIDILSSMMYQGNKNAQTLLLDYANNLPLCKTIDDVHVRLEFLRRIDSSECRVPFIPFVEKELNVTQINATTTQWITALLKYMSKCPFELIREPLVKMLKNKRFSYKRKNQIKDILSEEERIY